jgi:predicted metal-binding membrane protein
MSVFWMAVVAGIIAVEKTLPWRRGVTWATAGLLVGIGVLLLAAPDTLPGLTLPSSGSMPMS